MSSPATTSCAAAAAAFRSGPSFVDRQAAAFHFLAIEGGDCCLSFGITAHFHKTESLRASGVAVHDHLSRLNRTMRLEHLSQGAVRDAVGQIAYVELLAHGGPPKKKDCGTPYSLREDGVSRKTLVLSLRGTRERQMGGWYKAASLPRHGPQDPCSL